MSTLIRVAATTGWVLLEIILICLTGVLSAAATITLIEITAAAWRLLQ